MKASAKFQIIQQVIGAANKINKINKMKRVPQNYTTMGNYTGVS